MKPALVLAETAGSPAVSVNHISKSYGGARALDDVSIRFEPGRVHALLGPNGSGKSTLIGVLGGSVIPDAGEVVIGGKSKATLTPRMARDLGIGVIYQHFSLAETLTVTDNIFLGVELRKYGFFISRAEQKKRVAQLFTSFGLDLDPNEIVGNLSPGRKQLVEIAKALLHEPRVLIFDEPTTALGVSEVADLLGRIRKLAAAGLAIIFISHLLDDVLAVSDEVTILRDGKLNATGHIRNFEKASLIEAIAPGHQAATISPASKGRPLMQAKHLHVNGTGPWDFTLHEGEILGLFGLLGAGRTEFLEGIFGASGSIEGEITLSGACFKPKSPRDAIRAGVCLVPSSRQEKGLFDKMSAHQNVILPQLSANPRLGLFRNFGVQRDAFNTVAKRMQLKPFASELEGQFFSGGNQQKLLIGRWLNPLAKTKVLLLDEPTQGVDVGARADIYTLIRQFAEETGHAVIIAASEVEELSELADRAIVLRRRRIAGVVERSATFENDLLHLAHAS